MSAKDGTGEMMGQEFSLPAITAAAHELKAPLALIRQLSLVLQEGGTTPTEQQELLNRITLTSERSLRLVGLLTKHARLEDALFQLEPVNVAHVCQQVSHELLPLAKAGNRHIALHLKGKQPPIAVANSELLRAVILGLCDNSLAYAQTRAPLELKVHKSHESIRIAVRDHGTGMPADVFKKLASRLGKSAQPVAGRPQSSGLGLYVASKFAAAMRGSLGVQRHQRGGVTFYVDMPASKQLSLLAYE
ncbi:MAG TPA: HAMP domain-containing sensor histidine kinase [Verrucomicrobiae bacterium]|nr:HAMP domain-containing sensor histidine kinase [Verrucomicrobiae bacterium]